MNKFNKYLKIFQSIIPYHKNDIKGITHLLGGMSNMVFLITTTDYNYILRVPFKTSAKYVDFYYEKVALDVITKHDITSTLIYFNPETGIKITKYIEGEVLNSVDYTPYLDKIVHKLKKLHAIKEVLPANYGYETTLNKYESYCDNINPLYYELKETWLRNYYLYYVDDKLVVSHGDIQRSNIVYSSENDEIYFLDFEFSRLNTIDFDLASFGNINFEDAITLTKEYYKDLVEHSIDRHIRGVKFYRMFQCLQWYLVALAKTKDNISSLKVDFLTYSNNYLKQAHNFSKELNLK